MLDIVYNYQSPPKGRKAVSDMCLGIAYAHLLMVFVAQSRVEASIHRINAMTFFAWSEIFWGAR